ncbi:MAG TPA: CoA transferase [Ilumatobacter sp.]|nr:CoA transferase [Ilumatobacter sp.]
MPLQLEGIRVVDLTSVVMGPYATQILADLGADVIVIEDRNGDTNRSMGTGSSPGLSGVSLNLMRNKRSVGLDIKSPDGYAVLQQLVATADAFVTNLRPGSRQRAGVTYGDIQSMRPDIVYCAAAGFPADGPRADDPAYDDVVQAASGMGDLARRAGLPVSVSPTIMADKLSGMAMAQAITAALFHRLRTGDGADLTMAMTEVVRSFVLVEHGAGRILHPPVGDAGYPRVLDPGRRPQPTVDGYISVLPYERHHYEALFRVAGREDLAVDGRLATRASRLEHSPQLYQDVAAIIATRTTAEWMDVLPRVGVPCTPIATLEEMIDELDLAEHPEAGMYRVVPPIVAPFVSADAVVRRPAPLHGQHGREVLAEVGYTEIEIQALTTSGTLFQTPREPPTR